MTRLSMLFTLARKGHMIVGGMLISNVVLYIVFLCIYELPALYQVKNKLRAFQPQKGVDCLYLKL